MRKKVGKAGGWNNPRAPAVQLLFQEENATPAVLDFLRKTKVGRIEALASLGEEGGEELDEIELRPQEGEGGWDEVDEERGGPDPP